MAGQGADQPANAYRRVQPADAGLADSQQLHRRDNQQHVEEASDENLREEEPDDQAGSRMPHQRGRPTQQDVDDPPTGAAPQDLRGANARDGNCRKDRGNGRSHEGPGWARDSKQHPGERRAGEAANSLEDPRRCVRRDQVLRRSGQRRQQRRVAWSMQDAEQPLDRGQGVHDESGPAQRDGHGGGGHDRRSTQVDCQQDPVARQPIGQRGERRRQQCCRQGAREANGPDGCHPADLVGIHPERDQP